MTDGAAAFRKIGEARAHFVDFQGIGNRELRHTLWRLAGVEPKGDWVLKDDTISKFDIVQFAREHNAYVVAEFIPAQTGKMYADGMEIPVKGDPVMRRPFMGDGGESQDVSAIEQCWSARVVRFPAVGSRSEVLARVRQENNGSGAALFSVATMK